MAVAICPKGGLKRLAVVAVLGCALILPQKMRAETLADALVGAYNHSGVLDQNRALLRAADEDVATAASALKPVLQWSAGINRTFGSSASFSGASQTVSGTSVTATLIAQLLLYDFGATRFRIEGAKEAVLATRNTLLNIEQQVLLRAVAAYMGVLETSETVALRQNNLRLLTQELRAARDRFEVGEVTRTDVALAESRLAQARSGLAGAQGLLIQAQEEYRTAVGRKPGVLRAAPSLPKLRFDVAGAKRVAVRKHPLMLAAQHQVAAAELSIKAGEAAMGPSVTLTGRVGTTQNFGTTNFSETGSLELGVGQTIYQGGALSAGVRRSMAQRDAQRANLHIVRHDLEQAVGNAYAQLASARAQLQATDRQIRAARIAFDGVREEAKLGARTTLDVLDSEQALLDALSAQVTARANLYVAAYTVLSSTGDLTAAALRLPVQIYDPAGYYDLVKDGPAVLSKQGQQLDRVLRALQKE